VSEDVERTYLEEALQKLKRFFLRRQTIYRRVFDLKSDDTEFVLADLAKFCRAHETAFDADPRITALLEGRREVYLRIEHALRLNADEYWAIYKRKDIE
jgi:hypothetical protein